MEESGRNHTPDKLPPYEREPLFRACDEALRRLVEWCQPKYIIGVGKFAESRALDALGKTEIAIGTILHPSPASPASRRPAAVASVVSDTVGPYELDRALKKRFKMTRFLGPHALSRTADKFPG